MNLFRILSAIALLAIFNSSQIHGVEPHERTADVGTVNGNEIPASAPPMPRTDILISGVYPHLTTYGVYSQNGAHYKAGHDECGIGAIVPWAGKLWMVNYAPHMPKGSEHKLFSIDPDLSKPMTVHPESVGGTPAGRMIHDESNQLLIAHYLIDSDGSIRTISPAKMPIRVTAIARHLTDPTNMVYYIDMEGSIWEANVHTLEVKRLFAKPVPGWHSKGGYTSQGRLVVSNNGELHAGDYKQLLVGGEAKHEEERGVLAEFDGAHWKIIERRQFTEVTGPRGILGGSDGDDPIWTMGWDRRSVRLKVLDDGVWHTFLLPKAAYCNDASHGWYTEWPRIREITEGRWMMDMHGMFYDFPATFSAKNSAGIKPIGSHLRYIPDFCNWNGQLVLATDETSIQGNALAGQPQSAPWFGTYDDLKTWGPANAYGGPWVEDNVKANTPSDPFLVNGFERRIVHFAVGKHRTSQGFGTRASDQQEIVAISNKLATLPRVTVRRGDWHKPSQEYAFEVNQPVTVFLAVDRRGSPTLDDQWQPTDLNVRWGENFHDQVYRRDFDAGVVQIPRNDTQHTPGSYGMPHTAFIKASGSNLKIHPLDGATLNTPNKKANLDSGQPVTFTMQIDADGDGQFRNFRSVTLPAEGFTSVILPRELDAVWMRFQTSRDCMATVFLHQTSSYPNAATSNLLTQSSGQIFDGLANVDDTRAIHALVYPAKRNRNLRVIASDSRSYEFLKHNFEFESDSYDQKLEKHLRVEPEFTVDESSVVVVSQNKRYRLPKGNSAYDQPFASGWPRAVREVESERHLANIHGTFYELPLISNGSPPAWNQIRPVSSHSKRITDFCSWNGLLVLSGIRQEAANDGHVFRDEQLGIGLWFGGVDDLWKFGKPVGRGGPWMNSEAKAGIPSDPYLMTGYEHKSVELAHRSTTPVTITFEIDVDGSGLWVKYKDFSIPANVTATHEFPLGFSACWVRAISDSDVSASVQFTYR
ncbi:hypothetical protein [Rubripirellula amarantea]|nr:hypothetical protein [Rubripirellula amarantea]